MSAEIYVNGSYQPIERAALAARDRGVLYGEAVYEGIKIVARRPLFLDPHLERLAESARALGMPSPWNHDLARSVLARLLAGRVEGLARLLLTRGEPSGAPIALAWIDPIPEASAPGTPPWRLVCHDERLAPYLPRVKHTNRLPHAMARGRARAAGADDALLVHRDGWVLEGTASNVFFFESQTLHTPEIQCGILPGITRDIVLALAPDHGFKTVQGRYPPAVLAAADECFLTFTSAGIKAVAAIGDDALPPPVPGPRTAKLQAAYAGRVASALAQTAPLE